MDRKAHHLLNVGVKLIGCGTVVFALIQFLFGVMSLFVSEMSRPGIVTDFDSIQRSIVLLGLLFPVLIGSVGFVLIRFSDKIMTKLVTYTPFEGEHERPKNIFLLALKIFGLGMLVYSLKPITDSLKTIYLMKSMYSEFYISSTSQLTQVWVALIPALVYLFVSLYFMIGGKWLRDLAFPDKKGESLEKS